ncbi:hypothetical protein [Yoonia sp. BS5-3]|uniref:DUF4190 domain-containing protein n=1 Tax=Yoonia phaeophyticola TaxID=3137369 RepID=A0ABZ2V6D2_9RHOB
MMIAMVVNPLIGFAIGGPLGLTSFSLIAVIIGTRLGLQIKGRPRDDRASGLVGSVLLYGIVECLLISLLWVVVGFVWIASGFDVNWADPFANIQQVAYDGEDWQTPALAFASIFGPVAIARAMMLGAMGGAAVGVDPAGGRHTPFNGAGTSFVPLLLVVLASAGSLLALYWGLSTVAEMFDLGDRLETMRVNGQNPLFDRWTGALNWDAVYFYILAVFALIWMQSIQAAGATYAYLKRSAYAPVRQRTAAPQSYVPQPRAVSKRKQAGDLWRSRM